MNIFGGPLWNLSEYLLCDATGKVVGSLGIVPADILAQNSFQEFTSYPVNLEKAQTVRQTPHWTGFNLFISQW